MLTNVLWTDLGRKFRKTLPRNDANLCDANKVQSDSLPSTSVDSLETCQKLEPLHQSLNLSESSQSSKTDNYAKQTSYTKEKRRDDDGISFMSDTQPKDLSSGSRDCDHLEVGSRNKDDTNSVSRMEPTLISRKRKKRLRSNLPDTHNPASLYKSAEQTKEQENDPAVFTELEKSSENYHEDPKLFEEVTYESIESDFAQLPSDCGQELALSASPQMTSGCSAMETFESSISSDTVGNSTLVVKDENELNTIEKPVLSEHSEGNLSFISAEPSK
nr:PREDICTED: sentrin-specific protease 7-like isoform X4 [Bos indicus]